MQPVTFGAGRRALREGQRPFAAVLSCADSRVAHGDLPSDGLVQGIVLAELAAGPPVPLDAGDCTRLRAG